MNNKELIITGILLFSIYSQMSMKFIFGFGLGLYVGTEYNVKPLVEYSKQHIIYKIQEINQNLEQYKKPEVDVGKFVGWEKKNIMSWFSDNKKE